MAVLSKRWTFASHNYLPTSFDDVRPAQSKQCPCRSQWPLGLRRWSTAVRLLGSWVRIPPGAWAFVCCKCCVCCQVEVSVTSWPLVKGNPTDYGASLCVISKPHE